jgi:hypothetical protein
VAGRGLSGKRAPTAGLHGERAWQAGGGGGDGGGVLVGRPRNRGASTRSDGHDHRRWSLFAARCATRWFWRELAAVIVLGALPFAAALPALTPRWPVRASDGREGAPTAPAPLPARALLYALLYALPALPAAATEVLLL